MVEDWRATLDLIARQFDAASEQSRGLFHLLVEVSEADRDAMLGPEWFRRANPQLSGQALAARAPDRWFSFAFGHLPSEEPRYRALTSADLNFDADKILRDKSGHAHAILERSRLRSSYFCGDQAAYDRFCTLAATTARALLSIPAEIARQLPASIRELCFPRASTAVYRFGKLEKDYAPITAGWDGCVFQEEHGVQANIPLAGEAPNANTWLLQVYRIVWSCLEPLPFRADRKIWVGSHTMPYEWKDKKPDERFGGLEFPEIKGDYFFSVLGDVDSPTDLNFASGAALRALGRIIDRTKTPIGKTELFVSYSHNDTKYRTAFEKHMRPLERFGQISIWSDKKLKPSDEWREEIKAAMQRATVAVILLTAEFLNSDFCTDVELKDFLLARKERGLKIIAVLCADCAWKFSPLEKIVMLPRDSKNNLRPIKQWQDKDKAWALVVGEIANALSPTVL